jgi:hypothetical protein
MQTFETTTARLRGSPYALLLRQVKQAGLLDRQTGYYLPRIGIVVILLAAGWVAFVLVGQSWWQLTVAGFLAVGFAQVGFLAHDAGHQQIFTTRRSNDLVGILLCRIWPSGWAMASGWTNPTATTPTPTRTARTPTSTSARWPSPLGRPAGGDGLPASRTAIRCTSSSRCCR